MIRSFGERMFNLVLLAIKVPYAGLKAPFEGLTTLNFLDSIILEPVVPESFVRYLVLLGCTIEPV